MSVTIFMELVNLLFLSLTGTLASSSSVGSRVSQAQPKRSNTWARSFSRSAGIQPSITRTLSVLQSFSSASAMAILTLTRSAASFSSSRCTASSTM